MQTIDPPSKKPFQVWTTTGTIHSGYVSRSAAEAAALEADRKAERLGIKTRYEIREHV
jgi:hypothetical protein